MGHSSTEPSSSSAPPPSSFRLGKARPASHRGPFWTFIHVFGSLKLAMCLFAIIIVACFIGISMESTFDMRVARAYLYEAPWFTVWIILLCVNLFCAAFTRWPWRKKHTGFIVTHAGIIILLAGGMIGRHWGKEGSMTLFVGDEPRNRMVVQDMGMQLWDFRGGGLFSFDFPADLRKPREERAMYVPVPGTFYRGPGAQEASRWTRMMDQLLQRDPSEPTLIFNGYSEALLERRELVPQPGENNPGVQLAMRSAMMGQGFRDDVLLVLRPAASSYHDMAGLAQIMIVEEVYDAGMVGATMQIEVIEEGRIRYAISSQTAGTFTGELSPGESVATGWADWEVTLVEALPQAKLIEEFINLDEDPGAWTADITDDQLDVGVRGHLFLPDGRRSEPRWFLPGETHNIRIDEVEARFAYGRRLVTLPMDVTLLDFEVTWDEGTTNPASFKSTLHFRDRETGAEAVGSCSMNRPASFPGDLWRMFVGNTYKFSQASWNPENLDESTVQILYDPGWLFKWIGSLVLTTGVLIIFYARPYRQRRPEDRIDERLRKASASTTVPATKTVPASPPEKTTENKVAEKPAKAPSRETAGVP